MMLLAVLLACEQHRASYSPQPQFAVPDNATVKPPAFSVADLAPPVVPVGANCTPIVQEAPALSVAAALVPQGVPDVGVDRWKLLALAPVMLKPTANGATPAPGGLLKVNVCVALTDPRFVARKVNEVGVNVLIPPVKLTLFAAPFNVRFNVAV